MVSLEKVGAILRDDKGGYPNSDKFHDNPSYQELVRIYLELTQRTNDLSERYALHATAHPEQQTLRFTHRKILKIYDESRDKIWEEIQNFS